MANISFIEDDFNYVSGRGESIDSLISNYYNYITKGDTSLITIVNSSSQICIHYKFLSNNPKILLTLSDDSISFIDENNNPVDYSHAIKLSIENGLVYYYVIISNLADIDPNKNYYLILKNLKDSVGVEVTSPTILNISPAVSMLDFAIHRNSIGEIVPSIGAFQEASNTGDYPIFGINGIIDAGFNFVTEPPTEDNPFGMKVCILEKTPDIMYNGWLYLVEEGQPGPTPGPTPVEGMEYFMVEDEDPTISSYYLVKEKKS